VELVAFLHLLVAVEGPQINRRIKVLVQQWHESSPKEGFVIDVHPDGHLGLLSITPKVALADEKSEENPDLSVGPAFRQWYSP
jgi:hypothetical protein